jgi:hypothetical protein
MLGFSKRFLHRTRRKPSVNISESDSWCLGAIKHADHQLTMFIMAHHGSSFQSPHATCSKHSGETRGQLRLAHREVTTLIKEAEVLSEKVRIMGSMSMEDLQSHTDAELLSLSEH